MNVLGEKSLIVLMALMLGLFIAWLITTDTNAAIPVSLPAAVEPAPSAD